MTAPGGRDPGAEDTADIPAVGPVAPADPHPYPGVPAAWRRFADEYLADLAAWVAADLELRAREAHAYTLARARFSAPEASVYANGDPAPVVPWSRVEAALVAQENARDVARTAEERAQARRRAYDAVVTHHEGRSGGG